MHGTITSVVVLPQCSPRTTSKNPVCKDLETDSKDLRVSIAAMQAEEVQISSCRMKVLRLLPEELNNYHM